MYYAHESLPRSLGDAQKLFVLNLDTSCIRSSAWFTTHTSVCRDRLEFFGVKSARLLQVSSHIFEGPFEKKGQIQEITCIIRAVWVWRTMHNDKDTNRAVLQPTSNAHRLHLLSHLLRSAWGTMGQDCWDPCNVNRDIWKSSWLMMTFWMDVD